MKKYVSIIMCIICVISLFSSCSEDTSVVLSMLIETPAYCYDPQIASETTAKLIINNCFEGLTRRSENGEITGAAAKSWDVSPDGLVYTFHLREDAVWHMTSNAKDELESKLPLNFDLRVTANDFVFALKRAVDPNMACPDANLLYSIANAKEINLYGADSALLGVKALSDYELQITLSSAQSNFPEVLCESICMPCNETFFNACAGRYGLLIKYILSNGPFYLSRFYDTSYRINRSSDYTGEYKAIPDAVWLYLETDDKIITDALHDNTYSCAYLNETQFGKLKATRHTNIEEYKNVTRAFVFNTADEILSNINIRLAFACATNTVDLAENAKHDPLKSIVPAQAAKADTSLKLMYDEAAIQNYLNSGLKELNKDTVSVTILTEEKYSELLKIQLQNWQKLLGVNFGITVTAVSAAELQSAVAKGDYDIAFYPLSCRYDNPADFFGMFTSYSPYNVLKISDEEYDAAVENLLHSDSDGFSAAYAAAETKLASFASILPVWQESSYFITTEDVKGINFVNNYSIYFDSSTDK